MKVWVFSGHYFPDDYSTGRFVTIISELVAREYDLEVITAQPSYMPNAPKAPWHEVRNGVKIKRCRCTSFDRSNLPKRALYMATLSLAMLWAALSRLKRGDVAFCVTNPPLLPYLIQFAARLKGARFVLLLHDAYPEVLVATGLMKAESPRYRFLHRLSVGLYRRADRVVTVGRDMQRLVWDRIGREDPKVKIITNWGEDNVPSDLAKEDTDLAQRLGLGEKFVVGYTGNLGFTHAVELYLAAAERLKDVAPDVFFLMIGAGSKWKLAESTIREKGLTNTVLLEHVPREEGMSFMSALDIGYIGFLAGMGGVSVPSRMYNMLASSRPIIAVAEADSELAQVVCEEHVGYVISPGDVDGLVAAILQARSQPEQGREMGRRARLAYENHYTIEHVKELYHRLFGELKATSGN